MNVQKSYIRTLDQLDDDIVEAWLFESREAREQAMAMRPGLRLHSTYKTLLCDTLEQGLLDGVSAVRIEYPVIEGDEPARFRLECYPMTALFPNCNVSFTPQATTSLDTLDGLLEYTLFRHYDTARPADSCRIQVPVCQRSYIPGITVFASTGWAIRRNGEQHSLLTEYEQIFADVVYALNQIPLQPLSPTEPLGPFFERLCITVCGFYKDQPLGIGEECLSLIEALEEEIYFTALEIFRARQLGSDTLQHGFNREICPGQIVPLVSPDSKISLSISQQSHADVLKKFNQLPDHQTTCAADECDHWLSLGDITRMLQDIGGEAFDVTSRQGRLVPGRLVNADMHYQGPTLAISGGQHANEASGIVGALVAAQELASNHTLPFTVCPAENIDGYALFQELCQHHPRHMHHAARNGAAGNDVAYGKDRFESAIRTRAREKLNAQVHVNLHGYPSHEWTRPLTGYVPRGFAQWTLPKGFFLIGFWRDAADKAMAHSIMQVALKRLYRNRAIRELNQAMLSSYLQTLGSANFHLYKNSIPWVFSRHSDNDYPVTLVTEAPDESVYGELFKISHQAQTQVTLAVAEWLSEQRS